MKLLRQSLLLLVTRWVLVLLNVATGVFVARAVGPEGKGALALLGSFAALLAVAAGLGLPAAAPYLHRHKRYSAGQLFGSAIAVWTAVLGVFAFLLIWRRDALIRLFFGDLREAAFQPIWLWLSFATLPGLLFSSLLSVILIVNGRNRLYVAWNIGGQLLGISLTWLLAIVFRGGVSGVLLAGLAVQLLPMGIAARWLKGLAGEGELQVSWKQLIHMFRIGLQQYLAVLSANIFKRSNSIVLALLLNISSVGHFAVAWGLYDLLINVPRALVWPMVGWFADTANTDQTVKAAQNIRLQVVVVSGLIVTMVLIGPPLIKAAYGQPFASAVPSFVCLLPGLLFRAVHLGVFSYFTGIGRPIAVVPAVAGGGLLNLALGVFLIPRAGILGAAQATVMAEMLMAFLSTVVFVRASGIHWTDVLLPKPSDVRYLLRVAIGFLKRQRSNRVAMG